MTTMTSVDIDQLAGAVTGPVLVEGRAGWAEELAPFNAATAHRPEVVVGATCTQDVAVAVAWAAGRSLPVAVQATGHGAEAAVDRGLLITTRRLDGVCVDPAARTVRVQSGARWSHVVAAAAPHGLAPLSGSSPDVGAVGYVLGGGLPILGRAFGFAADHVRSFEVVTADGRVRHVDADHEPELFWALRGGRGAYGVVTEMTMDLVPVSTIHGGVITYDGAHAAEVLHAWRRWTQTVPDEMCTSLAVYRFPDAPFVPEPVRGRCMVALRVAYVGSAEEGEALLAPMRAAAPAVEDAVADMPYTASASIHRDPTDPMPTLHRGTMLRALPADAADALLAVAGPQTAVPLVMVELRHLGGAFARPPRVPNAVPGRQGAYLVMTLGALVPPVADLVPAATQAVHEALSPWQAVGCPLTFLGAADPDRVAAQWPLDAREQLRRIKATYDPNEVFGHGHRIQSPADALPAQRV